MKRFMLASLSILVPVGASFIVKSTGTDNALFMIAWLLFVIMLLLADYIDMRMEKKI